MACKIPQKSYVRQATELSSVEVYMARYTVDSEYYITTQIDILP